jgi:hypothetical protein
MLWRAAPCPAKKKVGNYPGVRVLSVQRFFLALAIAFAAAGCWSLVSTTVVLIGLRAFGISAG